MKRSDLAFGLVLASAVLALSAPIFAQSRVDAQDKRVVSIYVDGETKRLATNALTVGEALERAEINLYESDITEPTTDTEITQDAFNINVFRARPVTVVDGNDKYNVLTAFQSPQLIAEAAGLEVYPEDNFTFERVTNFVSENTVGLKMIIDRATALTINLYGTKIDVRTHLATVGEVLAENDIEVGEQDTLKPSADTSVENLKTIKLIRIGTEVVAVEEKIPFPQTIINDTSLALGTRKVKSAGTPGARLVTYEVVSHNGKEVSRKQIQSVVSKQPIAEVVIVGALVPDGNSNAQLGQKLAAARGWAGDEWSCLYRLWDHESGWNHLAANPYSGAYGIPQSLPGSKMGSHGSDWSTNPATQISWGLDYIAGRYGSPCGAYQHWQNNNWY